MLCWISKFRLITVSQPQDKINMKLKRTHSKRKAVIQTSIKMSVLGMTACSWRNYFHPVKWMKHVLTIISTNRSWFLNYGDRACIEISWYSRSIDGCKIGVCVFLCAVSMYDACCYFYMWEKKSNFNVK
jgi:hypothetical protein